MRLWKRAVRRSGVRAFLAWLGAAYIRAVYMTTRWQRHGDARFQALHAVGRPAVLCLWHSRFTMLPPAFDARHRTHMLISQHADGLLVAAIAAHFAIRTIPGSTRKGGGAAFRAMLKVLGAGDYVAVTPDGPRGPRMRASPGAVTLARLGGAVLLPMTYSTSRRRLLGSWDRFLLPLPFGRGVYAIGEPIEVPRQADDDMQEDFRLRLEQALNALTAEADRLCGHPPVEPAPVEPAPANAVTPGLAAKAARP
ncbi:MAG: DUF374 domain-containing protein [Alphaproteobacteria bacterium]|nr:DUF374 domain-containing protein [Alphaproteobacteria bacterium]